MRIRVAAATDVGRVRAVNQDTAHAAAFRSGTAACLAVVDGLGGHAGGEVASAIAIDTIAAASAEALEAEDFHIATAGEALRAALSAAHAAIGERTAADPALTGMGAVAVVAWLTHEALLIAHVGDCRAYMLDAEGFRALTADHSWVAEAVRAGALTAEEGARDPRRHVVTRTLGASSLVEAELTGPLSLTAGARTLLCSDGLHGVLADAVVATILASDPPAAAVRRLIGAANEAGGPDNIGLAVSRVGHPESGRARAT